MDPFEELEQYYPEIIAQMPQRFNSHEFILRLAHLHQGAYIRALALQADSHYPFQTVHSVLAKRLSAGRWAVCSTRSSPLPICSCRR